MDESEQAKILVRVAQRVGLYCEAAFRLERPGTRELVHYPQTLGKMFFPLRNECVIELAWLFHPNAPKTLNLRSSIDRLAEKKYLNASSKKELSGVLDDVGDLVSKIRPLRDKILAHRDLGVDYEEAWKGAEITYSDLRKLCETALKVANSLSSAVKRPELESVADFVNDEFVRLFAVLQANEKQETFQ